jgi:hypothetical protein
MDEIKRLCAFSGRVSSSPPWLLLRLNHRDSVQHKALESQILIEVTPAWQGIMGEIRKTFVMFPAFHSGTQEAHVTGLIDAQQVFDRVILFLAAVVFLLFLWIGWAMDRSLRTIMPTRGDWGTPAVCLAASLTTKSSALRTGSSS